jgi:hypothetical protein
MADVYHQVCGEPTATFTLCERGSANLPISLGNANAERKSGIHGDSSLCAWQR